jgi:serine/threonine protein kinase
MNELDIFSEALDLTEPLTRQDFLEKACAGQPELRQRLEGLLKNAAQASQFLENPPSAVGPTVDQPPREAVGTKIGPYKLLQQIGEGGMGTVFMAEQTKPVERRVALKIIKAGMDSKQVIARFEAERQALAMMDHPNIAKVLDAGATDSGRPYFVMELVRGIPITDYCDEHRLTPKYRLELFIQVLHAVQHAHQKGIIHRDIKPSNVLVAEYDHRAVPKVIDFGVAKATTQKLTDKTMFTQFGQLVGTFEYMSPEQAKLNQMDIDTRSDIYSLGVLLYELLTGETPFDRSRLRSAAFEELLRIIREDEPPIPSTRLTTSASLAAASAKRGTEPKKLGTLIRGELDWIVMKAIDKERSRRYETLNAFAEDIQRFLSQEAVAARPASAAYPGMKRGGARA